MQQLLGRNRSGRSENSPGKMMMVKPRSELLYLFGKVVRGEPLNRSEIETAKKFLLCSGHEEIMEANSMMACGCCRAISVDGMLGFSGRPCPPTDDSWSWLQAHHIEVGIVLGTEIPVAPITPFKNPGSSLVFAGHEPL